MITAQDINKLRQQTGAGMMDCKRALVEAGGDFEEAINLLRKRGQKISAARAGRATTEGVVVAKTSNAHDYGVLLALSCETDFVANNAAFQQLAQTIVEIAFAQQPTTKEQLLSLQGEDGLSVQKKITELVGKIGEKITISAHATLRGETVVSYIHTGSKLGVLVSLEGGQGSQVLQAGGDIAMQIAAMNPLAIDKEGIDLATIEQETAIAREQARNEGKPEAMLDKIALGRVNKFFKENTLLHQPFVKDNSLTVAQHLERIAKGLTVTAFRRVAIT